MKMSTRIARQRKSLHTLKEFIQYDAQSASLRVYSGPNRLVMTADPKSLNGEAIGRWSMGDAEGYVVYGNLQNNNKLTFTHDTIKRRIICGRNERVIAAELHDVFDQLLDAVFDRFENNDYYIQNSAKLAVADRRIQTLLNKSPIN